MTVGVLALAMVVVVACGSEGGVPVITPGPPGAAARQDVEAAPTSRGDGQDGVSTGATSTTVAPTSTAKPPPLPDGVEVAESVDQPNLLMIMTDDQTVEAMRVLTAVNARIGGEGTTFTNSVTSYPLCCPSRATYYSGQ